MATRLRYLLLYLALIFLLTGPVMLAPMLPWPVSYFLMEANALPLALLATIEPELFAYSSNSYWLASLMALQLWPLLYLAIYPALPTAPVARFLFLAYSIGLALFVVIVWLWIAALPSLG